MFVQLIFHAHGRFPWAGDAELNAFVRTVARVGGPSVVLFGFAGDHGHVVVQTPDMRSLGFLRSKLRRARPFSKLAAADVLVRPVDDRDHLATLIGYMGRQPLHHEVSGDPALSLGSSLPDLVGARSLPGFTAATVAAALPAVDVAETGLRAIGLKGPLLPAPDVALTEFGAAAIWRACRDALAFDGNGRSEYAIAARSALRVLTAAAGISISEARDAGEISRSAWFRLPGGADEAVLRVVRMRVSLVRMAAATPIESRIVSVRTPPPVMKPKRPR